MPRLVGHCLTPSVAGSLATVLVGTGVFAVHSVELIRHIGLAVAIAALGVLLIGIGRVVCREVRATVAQGMRQATVAQVAAYRIAAMRDGPDS